jgi:hypothetical protein
VFRRKRISKKEDFKEKGFQSFDVTPSHSFIHCKISHTRLIKGPSFCDSMLAVPSLTKRPELAETGLAVLDVLGVLSAASIVLGRPVCDPGLATPLKGRP